MGCLGYSRNHQQHTSSKWPKCQQQLHHTTTYRGCSCRGNKNATRLHTKDATCLLIKCNLFISKLSFWQNNEPASLLTTEKVVHDSTTMTKKTCATRPLFPKKNGASESLNYVTTQQLLRTRNQKKKHQV